MFIRIHMGIRTKSICCLLLVMFWALLSSTPRASAEAFIEEIMNAAQQGDTDAQQYLGLMYAQGQGVQQDDIKAYAWSSLAAAQGEESATRNRDLVAKSFTPDQLNQAETLTAELQSSIHKPKKRSLSVMYFVNSYPRQTVNQTELRQWIESIKPAAGGE